jgi:phosphoglycolate phosphatase-like HAD superfamily hydrolase
MLSTTQSTMRIEPVFLFDLDGTLVDSVCQHVLAWKEALDEEGIGLSVWRIHRKIGMSGGLFTNQLLRETEIEFDAERVERLRQTHAAAYRKYADRIRSLPGELLSWLSDAGVAWAIATSGRLETAGARRRGFSAVGYGSEELRQCGATRVYEDPADLLLLIDEVGGRR